MTTSPRQRRSRRYYDWLWPLVRRHVRRGLPLTQACERVLERNAPKGSDGRKFASAFYQAMARRQRAEEEEQ